MFRRNYSNPDDDIKVINRYYFPQSGQSSHYPPLNRPLSSRPVPSSASVIHDTSPVSEGVKTVHKSIELMKANNELAHYLKESLVESDFLAKIRQLDALSLEKNNPHSFMSLNEIEREIETTKAEIAKIHQRYEQEGRDLQEKTLRFEECSRKLGECTVSTRLVSELETQNRLMEQRFNALKETTDAVINSQDIKIKDLQQMIATDARLAAEDENTTMAIRSDMDASHGPTEVRTDAPEASSTTMFGTIKGAAGGIAGAALRLITPSSSSLPTAPEVVEHKPTPPGEYTTSELEEDEYTPSGSEEDSRTPTNSSRGSELLLPDSPRLDVSVDPEMITETTTSPGAGAVVYADPPSSGTPVDIIYEHSRELPDSTSADSGLIPTREDAAGPSGSHPAEPSSDVYKYRRLNREYKALEDRRCEKHKNKKNLCDADPTCVFYNRRCRTPEDAVVLRRLLLKNGATANRVNFGKMNVGDLEKHVDEFFDGGKNNTTFEEWAATVKATEDGWSKIGREKGEGSASSPLPSRTRGKKNT